MYKPPSAPGCCDIMRHTVCLGRLHNLRQASLTCITPAVVKMESGMIKGVTEGVFLLSTYLSPQNTGAQPFSGKHWCLLAPKA